MSAFSATPEQVREAAESISEDPPVAFKRKIDREKNGQAELENDLKNSTWFPYRLLGFLDKTHEFVRAYDRIYYAMREQNADLSKKRREDMKRSGHYLHFFEIMAPWQDGKKAHAGEYVVSKNWKHWVRARQSADKLGMKYDDYVAGALISSIKRQWGRWPTPPMLCSKKLLGEEDEFHDATIQAYEARKYAAAPKMTDHQYFLAESYEGAPLQDAYLRYLAAELHRANPGVEGFENQKVRRIWREFQKNGRVPAFTDLSDVLQS